MARRPRRNSNRGRGKGKGGGAPTRNRNPRIMIVRNDGRDIQMFGGESGLTPRKDYFGQPGLREYKMSYDGEHISFIAPTRGIENICVGPTSNPRAAMSASYVEPIESILTHYWTYNPRYILYLSSIMDNENFRLSVVDIEGEDNRTKPKTEILTPAEDVQARLLIRTPRRPDEALVGLNDRDPRYHDVHLLNFVTGEMGLHEQNDIGAVDYLFDHDFNTRFARVVNSDGSMSVLAPDGSGGWDEVMKIEPEDTLSTYFLNFDITGRYVYMRDSRGRNTAALTEIDTETFRERTLASDPLSDMADFTFHPRTGVPQGVGFEYERFRWVSLERRLERDFNTLYRFNNTHPRICARSSDDAKWLVQYSNSDGPEEFYLYDRKERSLRLQFPSHPHLYGLNLSRMRSTIIKSRDGLNMVAYYTLPKKERGDIPRKPLPTVLNVHGGPWARDQWGFDEFHQVLSDRGYAVISVNFRGSEGFGKEFLNAGNREWAGKMHEDLLDTVDWAVKKKITDRDKVAVMGSSYGGYAALVGLTFTPDAFACGIDICGPSDLVNFLNSTPAYWEIAGGVFKNRVGDHTTEEGREFLRSISPLSRVGNIAKPLLVVQGGNDPRVNRAEADRLVDAMKARGIPVIYLLFPMAGHGIGGSADMRALIAVMEVFLQQRLGGEAEPIGEDAFIGSTMRILDGIEQIPGAEAAVKAQEKDTKEKIKQLMKMSGGIKRLLPERVRRGRLF